MKVESKYNLTLLGRRLGIGQGVSDEVFREGISALYKNGVRHLKQTPTSTVCHIILGCQTLTSITSNVSPNFWVSDTLPIYKVTPYTCETQNVGVLESEQKGTVELPIGLGERHWVKFLALYSPLFLMDEAFIF